MILEEYAAVRTQPIFAFPSDDIIGMVVMFRLQSELIEYFFTPLALAFD